MARLIARVRDIFKVEESVTLEELEQYLTSFK